MVSVDGSVFIQIVNFLFLIWILNVILYKPVRKVLLQRQEKIAGLEQDIDGFGKDVKAKNEAFSSGIKDARAKGLKEKEAIIEAASSEEKEIIGKLNDKAAADLASVREQIVKDAEAVKASLMKEVDVFANSISQKILGRTV